MQFTLVLIFVTLMSSSIQAQVPKIPQGTQIRASDINILIDRLVPIGTIYKSLLTPAQFYASQGNCWTQLDGSSLSGTDLGELTNIASLSNATVNGEFLRQAISGRSVGSAQGDAIRNITASTNFSNDSNSSPGVGPGNSISGAFFGSGTPNAFISDDNGSRAGRNVLNFSASNANGVVTDTENRPVNIAVNFFIKINKNCNFN